MAVNETPAGDWTSAIQAEHLADHAALGVLYNDLGASVTGARDETEGALADLLAVLATIGIIADDTTAS